MSSSIESKWNVICNKVASYDDVDALQFNALMERVEPQAMSDGFLLITADNSFLKNWIERNFLGNIKRALEETYGIPFVVVIEVDKESHDSGDTASRGSSEPVASTEGDTAGNPFENAASSGIPDEIEAVPDIIRPASTEASPSASNASTTNSADSQPAAFKTLTFENFMRGDSNRMAYSMAVQVAEIPGRSIFNPLFIYGKSGLGKTHLMRAIQNYINSTQPELNTVYEDTDNFVSGYVNATIDHTRDKNSYQNFIGKYENADVLLIDDVQFLQNKEGTIDIIFQIFNKLINQGKQIVLSADRAPKNIDIDERYTSRFAQGGTIDIKPPEVETKLAIVKSFIGEHQRAGGGIKIDIPEEIQLYIAESSGSNIRELKSAVTHLVMHMTCQDDAGITLAEARNLLENHFSRGLGHNLTIEDIQKEVESFYRVKHADLVGQSRSKDIVIARQMAMFLSRQLLDESLKNIGKKFNRDHSTVVYSIDKIEKDMLTNRDLQEELEAIKKRINELA